MKRRRSSTLSSPWVPWIFRQRDIPCTTGINTAGARFRKLRKNEPTTGNDSTGKTRCLKNQDTCHKDKTRQYKTRQDNIIYRAQSDCERGENAERSSDVSARKARARETEYPKDFEKLWKDYPRKERKRESFKAYAKALETHDAATLDGAVRAYVERCRNEAREPRYVPMLFRVLADIDEYPAAVPDPDEGLTPKEIFERDYRAAFPALFEEESAARKLTPKEEYERDLRAALPAYFEEEATDGSPSAEDGATVFDAEFMPPTHEEDGETE